MQYRGVTDVVAIADLWRQHYAELFNCIKYEPYHVGKIDEESICFHPNDVLSAIGQLADKKASGLDNITAEHLKLAGPKLAVLSICGDAGESNAALSVWICFVLFAYLLQLLSTRRLAGSLLLVGG